MRCLLPSRGGSRMEAYQLVPVLRAIRRGRVRLLLADGVGLGSPTALILAGAATMAPGGSGRRPAGCGRVYTGRTQLRRLPARLVRQADRIAWPHPREPRQSSANLLLISKVGNLILW